MKKLFTILLTLAVLPILFLHCEEEEVMEDINYSFNFQAMVGSETFDCSQTYDNIGSTNATITFTDFRFYIHDVQLTNVDGETVDFQLTDDDTWQTDQVALLDFEDQSGNCSGNNGNTETRTMIEGMAPEDDYMGISFKVGVPFELNHLDYNNLQPPMNASGMFWAWLTGYKFMRIDIATQVDDGMGGTMNQGWNTHIGSTGCSNSQDASTIAPDAPCTNPNIIDVSLSMDPTSEAISIDYAAIADGADVTTINDPAPGCMSGPTDTDCTNVFPNLGLDFMETTAGEQTVFGS